MTFSEVVRHFHRNRITRPGQARAHCLVHQRRTSRNRTLSLLERKDGSTWLTCFAGCDKDLVLASVGLKMIDLRPDTPFTPQMHLERSHRDREREAQRRVERSAAERERILNSLPPPDDLLERLAHTPPGPEADLLAQLWNLSLSHSRDAAQ